MISLTNIDKRHGHQALFVDASFQLHAGEKVGLVGPNGAGKSTIFRLITGEDHPDDGDVSLPKRVTIGHFQALKHQLANMAVEVEPGRGLFWYAAHAFDHIQNESERAAALAKSHLTDTYMQIARDSVEAHGGIGFTWECDVQIYFKRALFDRAFLGTPAVHRERAAVLAGW